MNADQRVETLEGEIKLLKNEIKAILLDIREHYLDYQNPFAQGELPSTVACGALEINAGEPTKPVPNVTGGRTSETDTKSGPGATGSRLTKNSTQDGQAPPTAIEDQPEAVCDMPLMPEKPETGVNPRLGLRTIAGLNQWVDETTTLMGRSKLEALIEVCYIEGQLPSDIKDVVLVLARPCTAEATSKRTTGEQYLTALSRLSDVLGTESQGSAIQSSLMFMDRKTVKKKSQPRKRTREG